MSTPRRVDRYLEHLDSVTGSVEPVFKRIDSTHSGLPPVTAIIYQDLPEPGLLTGLTYGLSLADHPEWILGKPELCICVESEDISWALAIAFLAEQLRGTAPFRYGDTLNFREPMSAESSMTAFTVFAPAVLDREDFTNIEVGDGKINIVGMYPIHDSERTYIHEHGLEAFWKLGWEPYDITRPPVV